MALRYRALGALALAMLLQQVALLPAAGQDREIKLEKAFTTEPGISLTPLYIHDAWYRKEISTRLEKEKKLTKIEAMLAADLSGLSRLMQADEESQKEAWKQQSLFYRTVAGAAELAGQVAGFADEAPSVMAMYELSARVARRIDRLASERHALEEEYFNALAGAKQKKGEKTVAEILTGQRPPDKVVPFRLLGADVRQRIDLALRRRVLDMRLLRQNTIENILLATRYADASGVPTAAMERTVAWMSSSATLVQKLKDDLAHARIRAGSLQGMIESKALLLRHADKILDQIKADPQQAQRRAYVEKRKKKLEAEAKKLKTAFTEAKAKIKELEEQLAKAKLGVKADGKVGRTRANAAREHSARHVAAISPAYAELSIRRRINERATREAAHLFRVAKGHALLRRTTLALLQRQAAVGADVGFEPKDMRSAFIDQGLVAIADRELKAEGTFLGQVDYFNGIAAHLEQMEGRIQGESQDVAETQFAVDLLQGTMQVFAGAVTTFFDQAKAIANLQDWHHFTTELDKTHEKLRKQREDTETQVEFLLEALDKDDASLRAFLGIEKDAAPKPFTFESTVPKPFPKPLDLFREDKAFYDALDGGLRRVASSLDQTRTQRLTTEYLIAYEKACYTLRDLMRLQNSKRGLDEKKGTFTFKVFLSPVKASLAAHRAMYEWFFPVLGPTDLSVYIQKRGTQVKLMEGMFPLLKKVDFDLAKVYAARAKAPQFFKTHFDLWYNHPDYRRFWHKAAQEDVSEAQAKLLAKRKKAKDWWEKNLTEEKLEVAAVLAPSPKALARAHWQDAQDFIQLYNYPSALKSMMAANELDFDVVSTDHIRAIENRMALWTLGETSGALATQIGDQIAWYLITQGINGSLGFEVSFPKGWGEIADFFHGQINPLSGIISVQTFMEKGATQALGIALLKTTSQLGQDALRDDFLIRKARMDPAVADRVAGLFWNLVEESVKATAGAAKARVEDSDLYKHLRLAYYSRELVRLRQEMGPIQNIAHALDNPAVFEKWRAGRRLAKMIRAAELQETIYKLREDLGLQITKEVGEQPLALPAPPDDLVVKADEETTKKVDEEEATPKQARAPPDELADAQAERKQLVEPLDPADIVDTVRNHPFSVKGGEDVFAGKLSKAQRLRRVREAANLLGKYRGRMEDVIKALGDKSKWKAKDRQEVLATLDMARRVLNLESFNHLEASISNREFRRIAMKADTVFAARGGEDQGLIKPSDVLTPQRLKAIMDDIALVAPTGSGGYVDAPGGEYKKLTSDLDLTVVLKNKLNPPLSANERVALECMLQGTFRRVSNGLSVDDFDMSFMADERIKFSGESIEQRGPKELLDLLDNADPTALADHVKDINSALEGLYADLPHGERYLSPDRIMGLVWLTSLGQDVYVKENGAFVRRKKSDLIKQGLDNLPEDVRGLVLNERARLSKWMALGIAIDDAGFLGKKLPKKAKELKNPDLEKHPYDGYVKELDKRAIRILMGFLTTHPEGLSRLNALPEAALKGATVDHSTICKIGARMLKKLGAEYGKLPPNLAQTIETWGKIKMGRANADDLVRLKLGLDPDAPLPYPPGSKEYAAAFNRVVADTKAAVDFMAQHCIRSGATELKPLFDERKALRKAVEAQGQDPAVNARNEQKLKAIEDMLKLKLTAMAAWYDDLGGHIDEAAPNSQDNVLKRTFRDSLRDAGCDDTDFQGALNKVKELRHNAQKHARLPATNIHVLRPTPQRMAA